MMSCWNAVPRSRPSFADLHHTLAQQSPPSDSPIMSDSTWTSPNVAPDTESSIKASTTTQKRILSEVDSRSELLPLDYVDAHAAKNSSTHTSTPSHVLVFPTIQDDVEECSL